MSYINAPTAASDDLTSIEEAYINSLVAQSYTSGSILLAGGTGVIPTELTVGSTNEILAVKSDGSLHFKSISAGSNITISQDDTEIQISANIEAGTGTVTSVSVATANGVSGVVTNPTSTPEITLTLGSITPSAVQISGLTASELTATDASKNLVSLAVATYPSLTELTYVKGVSSAIQTQLDGKSPTAGNASLITVGTITTGIWNGTDIAVADGGTGGSVAGITLFNNITGYTAAGATGTTSTNLVFSTSPTLVTPLLGTPTSGTLTNCTGLPLTGLVSDTTTALGIGSINLGHASDTTIARVSAGVVSIEGVNIVTISSTDTLSNKTLTAPKFTDLGFIADANGNELIVMDTVATAVNELKVANAATGGAPEIAAQGGDTDISVQLTPKGAGIVKGELKRFMVRLEDSATSLAVATTKGGDYRIANRAITVKAVGVYVDTAAATGSALETIDINEAGATILSTKITIDVGEKTSTSAATAAVISDTAIAADAIITIDIDTVNETTPAKGLVVWIDYVYA